MRMLVIGAGGFLGGHLVNRLVSEGHDVIAVSRRPTRLWYQLNSKADNRGDWLGWMPDSVDRVYNLAADVGGMPYQTQPDTFYNSMRAAMFDLGILDHCKRKDIELVYTSSVCVYGDLNWCTEDGELRPTAGYGEAKRFVEKAIQYSGLRALVVRLDNTFGTHGDYCSDRAKAPMAIAGRARKPGTLKVYGAPATSRGFLSVRQTMEALRLLEQFPDMWNGQPTNISCGEQTTLKTLADIARPATPENATQYDCAATIGARKREVSIMRFVSVTGSDVLDKFDAEGYRECCEGAPK